MLPYENSGGVKVALDCETRDELAQAYADKNKQLYQLLARPGAPEAEPPFLPFPDPQLKICVSTAPPPNISSAPG